MRKLPAIALILLVGAASASATIHNVPSALYPTIQAGIDSASAGDTVQVAAGVYTDIFYPPGADTTQCVVHMKTGVSLIGAGKGLTIIDPQTLGRGIYCYGVASGRIEGLTVRNAFAQVYGAGIYCTQGSSPTIEDCEVTSCTDGGIIITYNSHPDLLHCDVTDNGAKQGGGIAIEDNSSPTITGCTVTGNYAPAGGGVYIRQGCAPTMDSCVVDSNYLNTLNGAGGGIGIVSASLTLRNSTVNGNLSTGTGGGIAAIDNTTLIVKDTYIQGNSTTADYGPGGGIYVEFSDVSLARCTITKNSCPGESSDGGGIYIFFTTTTTIDSCTIAQNGTGGSGGGLTCNFASPAIDNTIIAFNGPGAGLYCTDGGSVPVVTCSDLFGNAGGDAICGTDNGNNFSLDPLFCDTLTNDYALKSASPCISGAPCGQIGAHGHGTCEDVGIPAIDETAGILPPLRHYASPNPFGPSTTIHFTLHRTEDVRLAIYDVRGRMVKNLENKALAPGEHLRTWDSTDDAGRKVSSGVYFYRLDSAGTERTGRLILTR